MQLFKVIKKYISQRSKPFRDGLSEGLVRIACHISSSPLSAIESNIGDVVYHVSALSVDMQSGGENLDYRLAQYRADKSRQQAAYARNSLMRLRNTRISFSDDEMKIQYPDPVMPK